ncbi:LamG-like jellyroll fold domain-containing protein [Paracoccus sp. CPCC 101403]|uniref:LamG-like jellyroll fold domain-containing protein n=1 Tax=Paracoccus broussonetiae TaxID=3075834 RepID=A0ABU3EDN4_9RHOB|nr:LamG-like jellyroll fold domain-containing protein [Paracoccus sp. CPCC 101403]MDT1061912.1 LamG-like jellyroll fold domain-containing protein [Paracoccus sp. CPCC 101403]
MTQYLNTIIDRPVTDVRHFTSILKADATVKHAWTLVQKKAFRNPANNRWRIPARKGSVPLDAYDDNVTWTPRGNFQVPAFTSAPANAGKFNASIPNPGNVISVLMNFWTSTIAGEAWSLTWASDASVIWGMPRRSTNYKSLALNATSTDLGAAAPVSEWGFMAAVIDLSNATFALSLNGGAFDVATAVSGLTPKADANLTLMVGQGSASQQFANGNISDLAIVAGDVRSMPVLMSAWNDYNLTGYAA